jgi:hypothetical protein
MNMNTKEYTNEQLNGLLAEVEKEFSVALAKAEGQLKLAKSEDFPPKKDESKEKDEAKASAESKGEPDKKMESEKPADKGVKDQNQQDTSKEVPKGAPMESKEERVAEDGKENAAPTDDAHGEAEDSGYDDEDMQHMHSMYSSMSKPELKAHHDSIRKCMDGMGLAKCEDGLAKAEMEDGKEGEHRPNGGPTDGEAASKKTAPSSDAQAMNKSEPNAEVSLLKSELAAEKAKSDERQKNLEAVESFLKKFVEKTAPAGKAITSLDIIAKTENINQEKPLSKSEIDAKLLAKAKDISLAKSDRDAINGYYFSKDITKVSHLLK